MDWAGVRARVFIVYICFKLGEYIAYSNNKIKNLKRNILREGPYILCMGGWGTVIFCFSQSLRSGSMKLVEFYHWSVCVSVRACTHVQEQACTCQRILVKSYLFLFPQSGNTHESWRGNHHSSYPCFSTFCSLAHFKNHHGFNYIITFIWGNYTHLTGQSEIRSNSWGLYSHFCTITSSQYLLGSQVA